MFLFVNNSRLSGHGVSHFVSKSPNNYPKVLQTLFKSCHQIQSHNESHVVVVRSNRASTLWEPACIECPLYGIALFASPSAKSSVSVASALSRSASATSIESRGSFEYNEGDLENIMSGRHGPSDDWGDIDMELARLSGNGGGGSGDGHTIVQRLWVPPVPESSVHIEDVTDMFCEVGAIVPYDGNPGGIAAHVASESVQCADVLDHVLKHAETDAIRRKAVQPICAAVGYLSKQLPKPKRTANRKSTKPKVVKTKAPVSKSKDIGPVQCVPSDVQTLKQFQSRRFKAAGRAAFLQGCDKDEICVRRQAAYKQATIEWAAYVSSH